MEQAIIEGTMPSIVLTDDSVESEAVDIALSKPGGQSRRSMHLLQVRSALRELRDSFTQLLHGRRAGVPAALLAAAGRAGNVALQVDAAKALLTALQTGTSEQVLLYKAVRLKSISLSPVCNPFQ